MNIESERNYKLRFGIFNDFLLRIHEIFVHMELYVNEVLIDDESNHLKLSKKMNYYICIEIFVLYYDIHQLIHIHLFVIIHLLFHYSICYIV